MGVVCLRTSSLSCRAVSREQASPAATTESGESGEPAEQLDSGDTGQSSPGINDFHYDMAPQPLFSKKKMKNYKIQGNPCSIFFFENVPALTLRLFLGVRNRCIFVSLIE